LKQNFFLSPFFTFDKRKGSEVVGLIKQGKAEKRRKSQDKQK
jgi:hypothetical protein